MSEQSEKGMNHGTGDAASGDALQRAWIDFVTSVEALLDARRGDSLLREFLPFRDKVLTLVQGDKFLKALADAYEKSSPVEVRELLVPEVRSFPRMWEEAQAIEKRAKRAAWLERGSTVVGSVKDLLDDLPPLVKGGLTLLMELISLFRRAA